jgi:hypothetical protein
LEKDGKIEYHLYNMNKVCTITTAQEKPKCTTSTPPQCNAMLENTSQRSPTHNLIYTRPLAPIVITQ